MYEVAGESVIPGIDCKNIGSIFEEHTLCNELDASSAQRNVFALAERKFDFGAVLAAVGGSAPQSGVQANLKFTNIFKVPKFPSLAHQKVTMPQCAFRSLTVKLGA